MDMRRRKRKKSIDKILIIVVIFLLLSFGTAYSYMSQRLDVNGNANIGGNIPDVLQGTICDNVEVIMDKTSYVSGDKNYYTTNFTIKNVGETPIYYWHVAFRVPNDAEIIPTSAESELGENAYLLVTGVDYNTYISAGSSISFTIVVGTKVEYEVKKPQVYNCTYKQGTGDASNDVDLKVDLIDGGGWGNTKQYTVRVTNNSEVNIKTWNLQLKMPANSTINSLWNGDYVFKDNVLEVVNKEYNGSLAVSASTDFGMQVSNTDNNFNIEVISIKGYK